MEHFKAPDFSSAPKGPKVGAEENIASRQIVQTGLGTTPDRGIIQSLWMEIPANCDLKCPYCFCATARNQRDERRKNIAWDSHNPDRYRTDIYIENVLEPFAEKINAWNQATPEERVRDFDCPPENSDGKIRGAVAIPGAGEPFHPLNLDLTKTLIDAAARLNLHLTIFTTSHWITDDLSIELVEKDIVLLVKYNSSKRVVQNRLVGQPKDGPFFFQREKALQRLIDYGFNKPFGTPGQLDYRETRLGIVTSVMNDIINELPDLLRFARRNNIVFDCDTILERGRGEGCTQIPSDEKTQAAFLQLQKIDAEEFGNHWDVSRSYIGTTCDRFRHHLYVKNSGTVSPCVGAVDVKLGNVKTGPDALYKAWNSPLMKNVIRRHVYSGKCSTCLNSFEHKCFSCLGRCRGMDIDLDGNRDDIAIPTVGCWNNRPSK